MSWVLVNAVTFIVISIVSSRFQIVEADEAEMKRKKSEVSFKREETKRKQREEMEKLGEEATASQKQEHTEAEKKRRWRTQWIRGNGNPEETIDIEE